MDNNNSRRKAAAGLKGQVTVSSSEKFKEIKTRTTQVMTCHLFQPPTTVWLHIG
jgi:hypothetical protein